MARTAVIFGAGNIGRGFIGQLFCESGFEVTFVDIDRDLVDALERDRSYRLQTVFNERTEEYRIGPVRAIPATDRERVAEAVLKAEVAATAVGARALPHIAPLLATGICRRAAAGAPPLNTIVCENLKGAAAELARLVDDHLTPDAVLYAETAAGFVDTVIGRMVPVPTPEMRHRDITLIRTEPYKELPVDRRGFRGPVPDIVAMVPEDRFEVYTARKLYIHNCGHALLAYAAYLRGYEYGWEALRDPEIRALLEGGLGESVEAIVAEYGAEKEWLEAHLPELLERFANRALGDTVLRLGRDPLRKLAPGDRLAGPLLLASRHGIRAVHLAAGIAAGLLFDPPGDPAAATLQTMIAEHGPEAVLEEVCGIDPESPDGREIIANYRTLSRLHGRTVKPTANEAQP